MSIRGILATHGSKPHEWQSMVADVRETNKWAGFHPAPGDPEGRALLYYGNAK